MSSIVFNSAISINRLIKKEFVAYEAPTLVLIVGIHGNEVAGIHAFNTVLDKLKKVENRVKFKGNLYVLSGNMNAISKGIRHETIDLNRLWHKEQIEKISYGKTKLNADEKEQVEIYKIIKDILGTHTGKISFVDIHTTSSPTSPFIVHSDSINNRNFSKVFPTPIILGIEEYIQGPLLTYVNEFGHVGIGFEAGQHNDANAIQISESFIWMVLVQTGCLNKDDIENYDDYVSFIASKSPLKHNFFEIQFKHSIGEKDSFKMHKGFENFQKIEKGEELAISNNTILTAKNKGRIFMPLYQEQGEDGYFIISPISIQCLFVSKYARKLHLHNILRLLPGVKQSKENKFTLIVNPYTARFLAINIFHLFGYRRKFKENGSWIFIKREREIIPFI